jgi:hypothetical protein
MPAVLGEKLRLVEIDRLVDLIGGRIDVDNFQIFADRSWLEAPLPTPLAARSH